MNVQSEIYERDRGGVRRRRTGGKGVNKITGGEI